MEQQQDLPTSSEPADNNVSGGDHAEPRSDVQAPSDVPDLASQTANLHINDENSKPESTHDTTITTTSNDDSAQNAEGESTDSKLDVDTTAHTQKEQDTTVSTKEDDGINAGTSDGKTKDEYDTPRLATYIKLHNEMMTSKTALTSHTSEQLELYHKASHIAHTLLNSNEKHGDLPIVMHVHACLVLACSDEDDCYERMQEALKVVRYAMAEGALGKPEGEAMLKTCEEVMGMREFLFSDEEKIEGDGEADDEDDGESDEDEEAEGEGEGDKVDGELERNDALP